MAWQNGLLWEANAALHRIGELETLPIVSIGSRIALNRNHLKPTIESLDGDRLKIAVKYECKGDKPKDTDEADWSARVEQFQDEWQALMREETEWKSPAVIVLKRFEGQKGVRANDLARLMAVGIVVEGEDEATPKKKQKKNKATPDESEE